jgi:hypothetical protein
MALKCSRPTCGHNRADPAHEVTPALASAGVTFQHEPSLGKPSGSPGFRWVAP